MSLIPSSIAAAAAAAAPSTSAVPSTNGTNPFKAISKTADEIFGKAPELQVLLTDEKPLFHEAGVFFPEDNVLFVTSNFIEGPEGKSTKISRISLKPGEDGKVVAEKEVLEKAKVTLPNGGINFEDGIVFCAQGNMEKPGGLAFMKVGPKGQCVETKMLLDSFNGRQFNSPNDVAVHKDGSIWFTDPMYGSEQGIRPKPDLPQQVYRFDPKTKSVRAMVDGFGRPNGLTFSPDQNILYVTDTDKVHGDGTEDPTRPATIYSFKVNMVNDEPSLSDRRLFAMADNGIPDGIKCDTKGNVYSGCGDGVHVWSPGGQLLGKVLIEGGAANFCFGNAGEMFILNEKKLYLAKLSPQIKGTIVSGKEKKEDKKD
ncbi:hypothetical protein CP533_3686 [Ophiocordyceps camponoti-saundersi (nom. inval.)]|nr:hypothetical protein CP533_3686 [Ophiocordyceps camponoti-saundersi (nom. inval.)]